MALISTLPPSPSPSIQYLISICFFALFCLFIYFLELPFITYWLHPQTEMKAMATISIIAFQM